MVWTHRMEPKFEVNLGLVNGLSSSTKLFAEPGLLVINKCLDHSAFSNVTGNIWNIRQKHFFEIPMMTSSNRNIFSVTGHLQMPVTRSFGVFFDLRLNE